MGSSDNTDRSASTKRNAEITLRRLRVFWAVANAETMTSASKQLGLTQPSLSQQISSLESIVGTPLFERRSNQMLLTEAGSFLLQKAEKVLRGMQELEDGVTEFSDGGRVTIRVAGINSVLRLLLPPAAANLHPLGVSIEYDIHEAAPSQVLDMLYARRANIGLLASNSVAASGAGFVQVPLMQDPYVLAVPDSVTLDEITEPGRELEPEAAAVLNKSIRFSFGTKHTHRVQQWYDDVLPSNRPIAYTRSYDTALGLVRAGMGVCLAPALSCFADRVPFAGIRLYLVGLKPRRIVAMVPSQYRKLRPYAELLESLQVEGRRQCLPPIRDTPPFLARENTSDPFIVAPAL